MTLHDRLLAEIRSGSQGPQVAEFFDLDRTLLAESVLEEIGEGKVVAARGFAEPRGIDLADSGKAIAPESTRSPTPRLGRFEKGAFHMAMQAGVPVVPEMTGCWSGFSWSVTCTGVTGSVPSQVSRSRTMISWSVASLCTQTSS